MLTSRQTELWDAYLRMEARGTRDAKLMALNAFLDELTGAPPESWSNWAVDIARRAVDTGVDVPMRNPLFQRAVFPALLAGLHANKPGCARWLAGLAQHFYRSKRLWKQLPPSANSERELLKIALVHDPTDVLAKRRLVTVYAQEFQYALHELPAGVLFGTDGATPEQCLELQSCLAKFDELVAELNCRSEYEELLSDCEFHFRTYREYLLTPGKRHTYAQFLDRRTFR